MATTPRAIDAQRVLSKLDAIEQRCAANAKAWAAVPPNGRAKRLLPERAQRHVAAYGPAHEEPVTAFHSQTALPYSLCDLFAALSKALRPVDVSVAAYAVVLMDRYSHTTGLAVTTLMMHRLFITALVVATKLQHDYYVSTRRMAAAVNVRTAEMGRLELTLMTALEWRAHVDVSELEFALVPAQPPAVEKAAQQPVPEALTRAAEAVSGGRGRLTTVAALRRRRLDEEADVASDADDAPRAMLTFTDTPPSMYGSKMGARGTKRGEWSCESRSTASLSAFPLDSARGRSTSSAFSPGIASASRTPCPSHAASVVETPPIVESGPQSRRPHHAKA